MINKKGKNITCPTCKCSFYVKKSHLFRRKYCSFECRNLGYLGKKCSDATKIKMRKSHLGKKKPWCKLNSPFKKGHKIRNTGKTRFKKGFIPKTAWKKGHKPWSYIDGRSKNASPARYGDDWFKIRLLIYARDKFTCQECDLKMTKKTGAFHIHHKVPFLVSFDNSLKNLVTLCPSCHRKIEAGIMRKIKVEGSNFGRRI